MSDQFPTSKNTPIMTAPAVLEWLSGEIEDVETVRASRTNPLERAVYAEIAKHLADMYKRFAETTMRAMDGDTTAGRRPPRKDKP